MNNNDEAWRKKDRFEIFPNELFVKKISALKNHHLEYAGLGTLNLRTAKNMAIHKIWKRKDGKFYLNNLFNLIYLFSSHLIYEEDNPIRFYQRYLNSLFSFGETERVKRLIRPVI